MSQRHRGAHPDDARLFGAPSIATLRAAASEVAWLLERGYAMEPAVAFVGGHHQLESRQRIAITRATCAPSVAAARSRKSLTRDQVRDRALAVDGFNLVIGLEVALSGGVLLEGADGALRDLAGLRGTYRMVDETPLALDAIFATMDALGVARASFLLDAPVSNSGRLRQAIEERGRAFRVEVEASVVPSPDRALAGIEDVVSADAAVLDTAKSWANVGAWAVEAHAPRAWIVQLFGRGAPALQP